MTRLLLIDAVNVIGLRPDGWWRDRDGAVRQLVRGWPLSGGVQALGACVEEPSSLLDRLPAPPS